MDKQVKKSNTGLATFREDLNQILSLVIKHWAAIGTIGAVASGLLSFGILMTYSKAIGRIDLLPVVFDKKFSALLPWMGFVGFVFSLYMALFLTTTTIYALAVSLFNQTPTLRPHIARLLLIPATLGSVLFVGSVFQLPELGHGIVAATIMACMLGIMFLLLLSKRFRMALEIVTLISGPGDVKKWRQAGIFGITYLLLCFAAFAAVYPMVILLHSYTGQDTPEAVNTLTIISMVTVFLLFIPALIFFVSKKRVAIRVIQAVAVALIATLAVIVMYPGATSTIVYKSASMMGVRDTTVQQYRLLKNYDVADFATASWSVTEATNGLPIVSAFPLFSLGDVLLLCPGRLADTRLGDWPERSRACILTQSSDVVKLPEAVVIKGGTKGQSADDA
ncbi:hypothetical protein WCE02_05490 [Pseudomonas juntendi]|uniref:hypothetical protein n=1 Tax=Pseudomonas TaxID=286 RepID=UPI0034D4954C